MNRAREIIGFLKGVFNIVLTAFFALVAYGFLEIDNLSVIRFWIVVCGGVALFGAMSGILVAIIVNIKKIKD